MRTRYVTTPRVANRYLVRERDRRRWRDLVRLGVAVSLFGSVLLGYTWLHSRLLAGGYRVEALVQTLAELERQERHLRLEAAYLAGPARVEARALEAGMAPPRLDQLIFVAAEPPR